MSFNLNKTDQPASKFNLSKGDKPSVTEETKKSPGKGISIIIILLVIGSLSWYLLRKKPADDNSATAVVPAVSQKSSVAKDSLVVTTAIDSASPTTKKTVTPKQVNQNGAIENVINALQNSVPGDFDPGSSSLHPDATVVNDLVDVLSKNPGKRIIIKGYASSEGALRVNRQLSGQRAASFKEYLLSKGIATDRIITEAKGIENPVAANNTQEGRRKNRRVQVIIIN